MEEMQRTYGIKMTYNKAWRSRENALMAVQETIEESYGKFPSYLYMLENNNLGTVTDIQKNELGHFSEYDFKVDFKGLTCSCKVFDVSSLPCTHALAAAYTRNLDAYEFCSRYYSTESWISAYAETCYLVCHQDSWDIPENIKQ
ncbi:uncharacterized protein LOC124942869 [Impatiens glandulifera]|uniref:uncharacterized protein LOC124942869 n=1 Tax=Impatiens glandulifera TaxID=253017 RepID=UPI001FB12482|nr:uncharacterized protein LOC124942869 [Impatiens glandulifera]